MRFGRRSLLAFGAALAFARPARADDAAEDARARWLAGIDPPTAFEASGEWRAYAQTENDRWLATNKRIKAMTDWSAKELAAVPADRAVVYPFAGPDALHAMALFGRSKRVFMVGLEPVGTLPDATKAPATGYFTRLGGAQSDLHRIGFYRTQEMASDFSKEGVSAAIVGTLVRMGGKIGSVTLAQTPASLRVDWKTRDGEARRLDYVQADLANAGLKAQAQLIADIHGLAPYVTFVKAGMYLLGESRFSYLRQTILDESSIIVQDDTGLPVRSFDSRFSLKYYGAYEAPPPAYDDRAQPELKAALDKRSAGLLPFGFGYHVQANKACMIVATK